MMQIKSCVLTCQHLFSTFFSGGPCYRGAVSPSTSTTFDLWPDYMLPWPVSCQPSTPHTPGASFRELRRRWWLFLSEYLPGPRFLSHCRWFPILRVMPWPLKVPRWKRGRWRCVA